MIKHRRNFGKNCALFMTALLVALSFALVPVPAQATGPSASLDFAGYEWLVLEQQDGKALIVTKDLIDLRPYNTEEFLEDNKSGSWSGCYLRHWLNNDFFNALEPAAMARVLETEVNTSGELTDDKIFLLSLGEALQYFGGGMTEEEVRQESDLYYQTFRNQPPSGSNYVNDGKTTARLARLTMSRAQIEASARLEAEISSPPTSYAQALERNGLLLGGEFDWWLRSSGDITFVDAKGRLAPDLRSSSQLMFLGVRPALWVSVD